MICICLKAKLSNLKSSSLGEYDLLCRCLYTFSIGQTILFHFSQIYRQLPVKYVEYSSVPVLNNGPASVLWMTNTSDKRKLSEKSKGTKRREAKAFG